MKPYINPLQKAAKKVNLSYDVVKNIVAYFHEINNDFYNKDKLDTIHINVNEKDKKFIHKIAKNLKVTEESVIVSLLIQGIMKKAV